MNRNPWWHNLVFGVLVILALFNPEAASTLWAAGGNFTPGPQMNGAREGHQTATLPDGRVAVFGGSLDGYLNTAEIWNPEGNSFYARTMNYSHFGGGFARLNDGRYLLAGGCEYRAEIYDPATNAFTPTAGTLSAWRNGASAATLKGGKVLVVGGNDASGAYGEVFDPGPGSFTTTGNLQVPRASPVILPANDGNAYILGGWTLTDSGQTYLEEVEQYNAATKSFSLVRASLFPGESGWFISGDPRDGSTRSIETQKMDDGRFLLQAWKLNADNSLSFLLFTFNPATKSLEKFLTVPALPGMPYTYDKQLPLVDPRTRKAYLVYHLGFAELNGLYQLDTVFYGTGELNIPAGVYGTSQFLVGDGIAATLLTTGEIFLTGGYDRLTNQTTTKTMFITPIDPIPGIIDMLLLD